MARIQYTPHVQPVSIIPETTSVDRYWRDLSLPVWSKLSVSAASIATSGFAAPVRIIPNPALLFAGWYHDLAQPYPAKVALPIQEQLAYVAPVSEKPETVSEDKWHQPLSIPTRTIPRTLEGQFAFVYAPAPVATPTVIQQWPDVVRRVATVPWQQPLAEPLSEAPETTTVDRWYQSFSLPVLPRRAPEGSIAWSTFTPAVVTTFTWLTMAYYPDMCGEGMRVVTMGPLPSSAFTVNPFSSDFSGDFG
jgi:hypothetical protein